MIILVTVVAVQKFPANLAVWRKAKSPIKINCAVGPCLIHYHSPIWVALVNILKKLYEVAVTELCPLLLFVFTKS